jgi:hypothetical protein
MHPRRFLCISLIAMGSLVLTARAADELPKPDADGFITLFNGKDLSGWEGLEGYWNAKDGAIVGSQTKENAKHTFLVLSASKADPAKFANFELHIKYRFMTPTGNSGVQFRSKFMDPATYKVGGYQADMDPNRMYDGGLYDEAGQAGGRGIMANRGFKTTWDENNVRKNDPLPQTRDELKAFVNAPSGDWNDLILIADGNHITVNINGHLMGDIVDLSPKAVKDGVIAVQMHQGLAMTVQFKDIKIKLLDKPKN